MTTKTPTVSDDWDLWPETPQCPVCDGPLEHQVNEALDDYDQPTGDVWARIRCCRCPWEQDIYMPTECEAWDCLLRLARFVPDGHPSIALDEPEGQRNLAEAKKGRTR